MASLIPDNFETVTPSGADAAVALESSRRLGAHKTGKRSTVRIQLVDRGKPGDEVSVPASALKMFVHLLAEMG